MKNKQIEVYFYDKFPHVFRVRNLSYVLGGFMLIALYLISDKFSIKLLILFLMFWFFIDYCILSYAMVIDKGG